MKTIRLWATTTAETYQELMLYLAQNIGKDGKREKIGEFVEKAVIEKLNREKRKMKRKISSDT
ncbi:MAG: hypothetical protein PQJ47_09045 [Sphaerochaetaceae bacterium]|nr:hypothetical protein [Sphaerochaetaceae bacterium]MDC7248004.1 hypothetical protein [Sphaerochaetaceae bacterium]